MKESEHLSTPSSNNSKKRKTMKQNPLLNKEEILGTPHKEQEHNFVDFSFEIATNHEVNDVHMWLKKLPKIIIKLLRKHQTNIFFRECAKQLKIKEKFFQLQKAEELLALKTPEEKVEILIKDILKKVKKGKDKVTPRNKNKPFRKANSKSRGVTARVKTKGKNIRFNNKKNPKKYQKGNSQTPNKVTGKKFEKVTRKGKQTGRK